MKIVFQKSGHLNGTVSVETAYGCHSSESVASCCVVGSHPGRYPGWARSSRQDRAELLRWRPFPVRFTATVETSIGRGENWSLLLDQDESLRDQVMPTKRAKIAPRYPTPALEKGLDILELLANHPTGLTKSEVARSLDRTVSEIFRMLVWPRRARLHLPVEGWGTLLFDIAAV